MCKTLCTQHSPCFIPWNETIPIKYQCWKELRLLSIDPILTPNHNYFTFDLLTQKYMVFFSSHRNFHMTKYIRVKMGKVRLPGNFDIFLKMHTSILNITTCIVYIYSNHRNWSTSYRLVEKSHVRESDLL